jgi:hypothetical protein
VCLLENPNAPGVADRQDLRARPRKDGILLVPRGRDLSAS